MSDVLHLRLKINGVDYGQAGQKMLLTGPGHRITAGDLLHIGSADLQLESPPGVDADIRNQAYVEWYFFNVTQNRVPAKGRLFCGWVARRGTGQIPGTTQKTWTLPCQDINLLWEAQVGHAESDTRRIRLAAGTFAAQVAALFNAFNSGVATKGVDASSHVLNLTGAAVLPAVEFAGQTLRDMIGTLFTNARAVNPLLRPTATITPDPDIGGVGADSFGSPVLWVWDLAAPPSATVQYTTGTPDSTHFAIIAPFERALESPRFANWGQAVDTRGHVYTSKHLVSAATYPANPYDPDGVWKRPAYQDTQQVSLVTATGTATIAGGTVTGVTVGLPGSYNLGETPLIQFGGPGTGATARANMGGWVLRAQITNPGSGYFNLPTAAFSGGGGSGAAATVTVVAGVVTAVTVTSPGTGYTSAPTVAITGGGGSGATATATVSGGIVTGVSVTAGGTGYATPLVIGFSGGGGTGAAATGTINSDGEVSAITITAFGSGYTSAPIMSITGGKGTGATAAAQIGGQVLSVTMISGGTGYVSAPAVTFANGIQAALDAALEQTALPREGIPVTSRTPALPGTYAGLTLTLEAGIVETPYVVSSLDIDLTRPSDPIYTMQLGSRRLRLGEVDSGGDVYAPPIEGARLNPPTNWAQTNAFQRYVGNTRVTYTFSPPTPPPGMSLDHYDLHTYVDSRWWVMTYPGTAPGIIYNDVNPGSTVEAYLVAVGRSGTRFIESFPTPTLGPFVVEAQWAPDPPISLAVHSSGPERFGSSGWVRLQFTPPGTTHGPHTIYEVEMTGNGQVQTLDYFDPGGSPTILPTIHGLTLNVQYSLRVRTISEGGWYGTAYAGPVPVTVKSGGPPPNVAGGGEPAGDQPLYPYEQTAGTSTITVDAADPFGGAAAYKIVSAGADTPVLTGPRWETVEGQAWKVPTAAKKSGGSPTFAGKVEWSPDGTTWNVLTASTLTLPALTTAWPAAYTEQQVTAPSTANWGRLVYTATFAAALTIYASLPQPTAVTTSKDYGPGTVDDTSLSTLTDVSKFALKTGSGAFWKINDSSGATRGKIYAETGTPNTLHLEGVTTGGVDVGIKIASTYGDSLFVGDSTGGGGINGSAATGKPVAFSAGGRAIQVDATGTTFTGGENHQIATLTSSFTLDASYHHVWVDATGGNITVTLPAATVQGREYVIERIDKLTTTVSIARAGSDTIDGMTSYPLITYMDRVTLVADGVSKWRVLDGFYINNSTNWLTQQEFEIGDWQYYVGAQVAAELTATQEYRNTELRSDYAHYLTRWRVRWYNSGTNNGSNYWTIALRTFTGLTTLATVSTAGGSGGAFTPVNVTSFTQPGAGEGLQQFITKVGAPGGLRFASKLYARLLIA